jgi:hypothetical protein
MVGVTENYPKFEVRTLLRFLHESSKLSECLGPEGFQPKRSDGRTALNDYAEKQRQTKDLAH